MQLGVDFILHVTTQVPDQHVRARDDAGYFAVGRQHEHAARPRPAQQRDDFADRSVFPDRRRIRSHRLLDRPLSEAVADGALAGDPVQQADRQAALADHGQRAMSRLEESRVRLIQRRGKRHRVDRARHEIRGRDVARHLEHLAAHDF
jgi:hypothetical protein